MIFGKFTQQATLCVLLSFVLLPQGSFSQTNGSSNRTFALSKRSLQETLNKLEPAMAGRLPVLDGFVVPGDQPLDRYRRAYYQTSVQVIATSSEKSLVRVTTKITAWFADPAGTHSGYRLLNSNGRLESDLLDQLSEELAGNATPGPEPTPVSPPETAQKPPEPPQPKRSAPALPAGSPFSPSINPPLPTRETVAASANPADREREEEIRNLEQVLHNQGHPNNLVAVKQSGTPVVASPSLTAKTLFLASAHDEFEMLDFNADWVHVRISGLSRGWIWRNSLEMPDGIPDTATRAGTGPKAAAEQLFHVTREETAPFPGDWQPLKGKSVKILSIEKVDDNAKDAGLIMRLEFAKAQLDKNYDDLAQQSATLAGIVLIFDSADGGMIAATLPAMQKWKAGILSDSAFWHQCFFDPPELGGGSSGAGGDE